MYAAHRFGSPLRQRAIYVQGDLPGKVLLHAQRGRRFPIVGSRVDMSAAGGVGQQRGDAQFALVHLHSALHQQIGVQPRRDLTHVPALPLERERRGARDDLQAAAFAEPDHHVRRQAIVESLVLPADADERQHSDALRRAPSAQARHRWNFARTVFGERRQRARPEADAQRIVFALAAVIGR